MRMFDTIVISVKKALLLSKRHLKTHIQSVHENVRYNCDHCDKSFSHRENLIRHNKSAHDNVRHNCEK